MGKKATKYYSTAEVAAKCGVHKNTIINWLQRGHITEPQRDGHGWRRWTDAQLNKVLRYAAKVKALR